MFGGRRKARKLHREEAVTDYQTPTIVAVDDLTKAEVPSDNERPEEDDAGDADEVGVLVRGVGSGICDEEVQLALEGEQSNYRWLPPA